MKTIIRLGIFLLAALAVVGLALLFAQTGLAAQWLGGREFGRERFGGGRMELEGVEEEPAGQFARGERVFPGGGRGMHHNEAAGFNALTLGSLGKNLLVITLIVFGYVFLGWAFGRIKRLARRKSAA